MKRLLIIYSSQTGRTRALAEAALDGAAEFADEIDSVLLPAFEADLAHLLSADGLLIGSPENFGYLSGAVKDFLDRTYYPAEGKTVGLPYAMFVSAGNDGTGAVNALERIANGYQWKRISEAVICKGEMNPEFLQQARELGQTMAAGVAYNVF